MSRFAFGILLVLAIGTLAWSADACPTQVQQVTTVPVGVIQVPVYSAVYAPAGQQVNQDVLQEILAELKAMRAELQALRNPAQA
mgnify:CR=1 FL=1